MISVKALSKDFGEIKAVREISFEVGKGEIFGLIGENGAGKTTTLRMLATMLKPTAGTAEVCGFDIIASPEKVRSRIGILFGGDTGLYDRLSVAENIAYFAELNGMGKAEIRERVKYMAKVFGMEEYIDRRAGKLSRGMKQKAAFARSIVHDPDVMLFDEPTSGLDVSALRDVHDFILSCKSEGKTILFSSHSMNEVEKLCDRIGIIHKGRLLEAGSLNELREKYGTRSLEEIFVRLVGDIHEA